MSARPLTGSSARTRTWVAFLLTMTFIWSTVANKISFRLVLVPFAPYSHLLAVTTNMLYIVLFASLVLLKIRRGAVEGAVGKEERDFVFRGSGRNLLICAGMAEALTFSTVPIFASKLPGSMGVVLAQSQIAYSMLVSAVVLGKRYDLTQFMGAVFVVLGVCVCTIPKLAIASGGGFVQGGAAAFLRNTMGLLMSNFTVACSFVLKNAVFARHAEERPGARLSGNLVNLASALWQGLGLWLLWPLYFGFVAKLGPVAYLSSALSAVAVPHCWALLIIYWFFNVNMTAVTVSSLSRLSATVLLLAGSASVPLTALLYCFSWPLLGAEAFSWYFVGGLAAITCGLLLYNHRQVRGLD